MSPDGGDRPDGELAAAIDQMFYGEGPEVLNRRGEPIESGSPRRPS